MVPAHPVVDRLKSGWAMVSLDGAPKEYRFADADRIAARVASTLIRAGVAAPEHWAATKRDPVAFVQMAIEGHVAKHHGTVLEENFYLGLTLSSAVDPLSNQEELGDSLYLIAEPSEAGYLVFGDTLRTLEREHPRLPVTFYRFFHQALNRWARTFDYQDALARNEMLREWYESDPECEEVELPNVEGAIPACLRRKGLSLRGMRRLMSRARSKEVGVWMEELIALWEESNRFSPPKLDPAICEQFYDANPPLPILLTVFEKHDAVEGAFDDEAQGMLEASPEPTLILPVSLDDVTQLKEAFAVLGCFCRTLALASSLMKMLPAARYDGGEP